MPTYTTVYVLPKWIFKEGLPKVAKLTHQYVFIPVYNGIIQAAKFVSERCIKIAQAIYNHVLVPLRSTVKEAAVWTWKAVIIPIFNGIAQIYGAIKDLVLLVTQRVYNYALKPLGQFISQAFGVAIGIYRSCVYSGCKCWECDNKLYI